MQPVTHTDGQLVDCWLHPFALGLDVVDVTGGQVDETEGFWEQKNTRVTSGHTHTDRHTHRHTHTH